MPLKSRLLYLLAGWLSAGVIYVATGFLQGPAWLVPESFIDAFIPFSPRGIWLYLLFYLYVPYTFITAKEPVIRILTLSFILVAGISGILFLLFPSSMAYPGFDTGGLSAGWLRFVIRWDTAQNCFPSLHSSLISLCTIANWDRARKLRSWVCVLLTLAMYYAIIQVRRHVFIDLAAGIALAVLAWPLAAGLLRRFEKPTGKRD